MRGVDNPVCWAITPGAAGMISQVGGLAELIGIPFTTIAVGVRAPWRWLPGHHCPWALHGLTGWSDPRARTPPWPDLLISCGGQTVPVSIAIKRASAGRTFTVHVQNPKVPPDRFDMILAPRHDGITGPNVIQTRGALHGVTPEKLAVAADQFAAEFAGLPRPRVAVLIGGTSKAYTLTPGRTAVLANQLATLAHRPDGGAGLMVTTSRRTSEEAMTILRDGLADTGAYLWEGTGDNPYFGMLAHADHVLVTEDSVSMISEACATGKPVQTIALDGGTARFRDFQHLLSGEGLIRPFNGRLEVWQAAPLLETRDYAQLVREKLEGHRSGSS